LRSPLPCRPYDQRKRSLVVKGSEDSSVVGGIEDFKPMVEQEPFQGVSQGLISVYDQDGRLSHGTCLPKTHERRLPISERSTVYHQWLLYRVRTQQISMPGDDMRTGPETITAVIQECKRNTR
jgi:hypothetical protein